LRTNSWYSDHPLPPGEGRVRESNKDNVLDLYPLILTFSLREKELSIYGSVQQVIIYLKGIE
jgi:hypothetical protein